jgi:peroxiredoxin
MKKFIVFLILIPVFSISAFSQKKNAEWFSVTSTTGTTFDLQELRGKTVVLLFWSTSCEICRAELPKFNKLVEDNKDVVFLALTPEESNKVEPFLKKNPFKFNVVVDSFETLVAYADKTPQGTFKMPFPTFFLINKDGEIVLKTEGVKGLDKISDELKQLSAVVTK